MLLFQTTPRGAGGLIGPPYARIQAGYREEIPLTQGGIHGDWVGHDAPSTPP